MLPITLDLLTNNRNRPYLRNAQEYAIRQLKGVVVHWTANTKKGADAQANRNYFNGSAMFTSAHYVVDDHSIIQCIPDNEVAYHVGANHYRPDGERIRGTSTLTPNYFLMGFEMCVNEDGDWDKTYQNAVELAAHLLRKYRFTITDLYRHQDITGKDCPKMLLSASAWSKFKTDVAKAMSDDLKPRVALGRVISKELNIRTGPGTENPALSRLRQGDYCDIFEEKNGWLRIGDRRWVSQNFVEIVFRTQLGRVIERTGVNVRSGPGANFPAVDALPHLAFTNVLGQQDKWYELGYKRWTHSSLIELVQLRSGIVVGTDALNVRSGPGTAYPVARRLGRGAGVQIYDTQDNWLLIGNSEWVYEGFIQLEN